MSAWTISRTRASETTSKTQIGQNPQKNTKSEEKNHKTAMKNFGKKYLLGASSGAHTKRQTFMQTSDQAGQARLKNTPASHGTGERVGRSENTSGVAGGTEDNRKPTQECAPEEGCDGEAHDGGGDVNQPVWHLRGNGLW